MKKRLLIYIMLVAHAVTLMAAAPDAKSQFMQDLNNSLAKMQNENFMMEMSYNLYADKVEGKPEESSYYKIARLNNYVYTENHLMTYYSNSSYQASIYSKDKIVVINKAEPNKKLKVEQFLMTDSTLWNTYSNIQLLADTLNTRTYSIQFQSSSPVKSFEITFDVAHNRLIKNIISFNTSYTRLLAKNNTDKSSKIMVVEFVKQKVLTSTDANLFYNPNIKVGKAGAVELNNTLKSFKLYNYLNKR
ncbi:MAG: hypothetical protein V4643_06985 [Bacteroidota bacterium]